MDGYLSKPVDPQLLFAAVEQQQAVAAAMSAEPTPGSCSTWTVCWRVSAAIAG
jgi:hypothetical protein